jgi:TonB family protein
VATALRRISEEVEPLSKSVPGIDPELERIVLKSLARDRSARYAGAREMKQALEAFLARAYPESGASDREPSTGVLALPVSAVASAPTPAPVPASAPFPPTFPGTFEEPPVRKRARVLPFALTAIAVVVFVFLARTSERVAPTSTETPPVPENRIRIPTPAASTATEPAVAAPPPTPAVPASPAPAPARRSASRPPGTTPPAEPRRMKYPPDFREELVLAPPAELAAACAGKLVGFSMTVTEDGSLASVKVISPSGVSACDDFVLATVRKARFKPATAADGKPVEGRFTASVGFF